jgi:glycosyltransferase involved in cell wall biosynthesis
VSLAGRVALIGPVPPDLGGSTSGGVATHQAHLAAGLVARGVEAYLLGTNATRAGPTPFPMMPMRGLRVADPRYLRAVGLGVLARYGLQLARTRHESRRELLGRLVWYRRFVCQVRPRLIHVQHPLERCSAVRLVLEMERLRLPIVVTAHSLFGEHPESAIYGQMAPNLRAAERIIAVSPHVADQAVALGVHPDRVRVIRSGVDTATFAPRDRRQARQALSLNAEVPLVLFVGNLEPRKQLDVLLRAVAELRSRAPEVELAIVGSGASAGADDQTERLRQLSRELDLRGAVHFAGAVDAETLLRWYAAADVFALPSSSEAQGIVALEAMACGLPVVGSAVGGLLGTLEDGQTGYLVPPGDVPALTERILALLTEPARRARLGQAARRKVERDFSWEATVVSTIEVYREVLACG